MYKYLIILFILLQGLLAKGQIVRGTVMDMDHQPLLGATVLELGTTNGAITNMNGQFELRVGANEAELIVSFTGFDTDTLAASLGSPMHIMLKESSQQLGEVTISSNATFFDRLEPKHNEIISEAELTKAACCNLSESFETNASVDVSFSDAVTGAKVIRMLGLDGRYVQINRENIPHIRGLAGRNGLTYVPGTWIQSIDLGKGAGSVVNGYESMTGQINVEFKKPAHAEKLYFNAYVNSMGRAELNANVAGKIGDRWKSALLFHSNYFANEVDGNVDGFMDLPKSRQVNVLNRYELHTEKIHAQVGVHLMHDDKAGGQLGFGFGDDHTSSAAYGFDMTTTRFEVFGKTGLLFPHKPYKGWGFIYSASHLAIDGGFGRDSYNGIENTAYVNAIFQNIIGTTYHQYKAGVSLLVDDFEETYIDSLYSRREIVPGVFYEYSYLPNDDFSLVAGMRTDFHNLYGTYFTPRLHMRYQVLPGTTLRVAGGPGYRTPNVIMENSQVLVSARQLVMQEAPKAEVAWNLGTSMVSSVPIGEKEIQLVVDYFYTDFENQLIYDMDQDSRQLVVYNLDGRSYAHSFQVEGSLEILPRLNLKAAYKYYDVSATINGRLQQIPFVSRDRLFANIGYETKYEKWQFDATWQWFGTKRLPDTSDRLPEFRRDGYTPDFSLLNGQVTRNFRWGGVYLGGENLLSFTQNNPIVAAERPFSEDFDASLIWAPIMGRVIYLGFRYKIQ